MAALRQATRRRVLPVSRARTWDVLTSPATAARWLGASGTVDLRAPGICTVLTEADGTVRHVIVDQVEPGDRLTLRWWTDRGPGVEPSLVEITLDEVDEGTRVEITETALADAPVMEPTP